MTKHVVFCFILSFTSNLYANNNCKMFFEPQPKHMLYQVSRANVINSSFSQRQFTSNDKIINEKAIRLSKISDTLVKHVALSHSEETMYFQNSIKTFSQILKTDVIELKTTENKTEFLTVLYNNLNKSSNVAINSNRKESEIYFLKHLKLFLLRLFPNYPTKKSVDHLLEITLFDPNYSTHALESLVHTLNNSNELKNYAFKKIKERKLNSSNRYFDQKMTTNNLDDFVIFHMLNDMYLELKRITI